MGGRQAWLAAGAAVEAYAKAVIEADFKGRGDDDVIAKVRTDLAAKGIVATEAELRAELASAAAEARRQVLARDGGSGPRLQ